MITRRNQDLLPSLLDEMMNWSNSSIFGNNNATPKMNITESDKDYRVELCVPGLKKDDLMLHIDNDNNLIVRMSKKSEKKELNPEDADKPEEKRRYLRREFSTMEFSQSIALPENVKKEDISAKVENGVLEIVLPKMTKDERENAMKTIEIQ